jgi:glycosyltransferase involved in cell wall biosynthesis
MFFPGGGIGRYTHELMREMSARTDVEIEVICTPDYEWAAAEDYASWTGLQSISHDVPTLRRWRFLKGQFVNPIRAIERAVEKNLDVLHLANINHLTFPYWRSALEKTDVRVVASAHDVKRQKSIISRHWEDRQLAAFYQYADALFVHSEYQARELRQFADVEREKIHVVPHGPYPHGTVDGTQDEMRRRWNLPQDGQIALFFGQIRDEKNLAQFIRGLSQSEAEPYVVVAGQAGGRHRDIDYYEQLADRLGVADRMFFFPRYISDEEVGELFVASDWVALPYQTSFTSQSGVLNTAAHYERPVLVSQAPVLRETVEACDIGIVCEGDEPEQIAESISLLSRRTRDGYTHNFDAYKRRFSWQENARRTINAYKNLVQY